MRQALVIVAVLAAGCSIRRPPSVSTAASAVVSQRLARADALMRDGCLDCLLDAFHVYDDLRTCAAGGGRGHGWRGAGCAAPRIRERELGTEDSGYLTRARDLAASALAAATALGELPTSPTRFPRASPARRPRSPTIAS